MTAPTNPQSNTTQFIAGTLLVAVLGLVFPDIAFAAAGNAQGKSSLVFELKPNVIIENQLTIPSPSDASVLTMEEISSDDELISTLQAYLESKQSPLAPYAHLIIKEPNWQQAMGIIAVESTFCRKAANFNCGSVGVKPGHKQWRKFENHFQGFQAVATLLEKPLYKNKYNTCKKKMGVYVVPGSANWLRGCEKVEKDMHALVAQATAKQQAKISAAQIPAFTTANKELAFAN